MLSPQLIADILAGRRPGRKHALLLSKLFNTPVECWLAPEQYFNPYKPHVYQGPYPPSLSHLQGEALEFAQEIIKAFPHKPSWQEFKAFKREYRKKLKKKQDNEKVKNL